MARRISSRAIGIHPSHLHANVRSHYIRWGNPRLHGKNSPPTLWNHGTRRRTLQQDLHATTHMSVNSSKLSSPINRHCALQSFKCQHESQENTRPSCANLMQDQQINVPLPISTLCSSTNLSNATNTRIRREAQDSALPTRLQSRPTPPKVSTLEWLLPLLQRYYKRIRISSSKKCSHSSQLHSRRYLAIMNRRSNPLHLHPTLRKGKHTHNALIAS